MRQWIALGAVAAAAAIVPGASRMSPGTVVVRSFGPVPGICRAGRPITLEAVVENRSEEPRAVRMRLELPEGVSLLHGRADGVVRIRDWDFVRLRWTVQASQQGSRRFVLRADDAVSVSEFPFFRAVPIRRLPYIPEPQPVATDMLVGAHMCPLWEADRPEMWANVLKHPERTPALGFYAQENPEVSDWETKWAVEHGIQFFVYCWYRDGQGGPVRQMFGSALHDAFFRSRFARHMKFTIMWENQRRGFAGVADERDLFENLLPFWIENYFKHPSYLKVDGKPLLFIYRPEFLVDDLGSVERVRKAFDRMREFCRQAGFEGLWLLGEYRGLDPRHLELMKSLGLDYTFAYCWYVPNNPTPEQAIEAQMRYIRQTQDLAILPQVITVSQAWSGWHDEGTIWKIPPDGFERLLRQAKAFAQTLPEGSLGRRMLLLDNWNEWGEGHYIAPYREYGFGYLDAVRRVFSQAPEEHEDLIPEDIGFGPYDRAYRDRVRQDEELRRLCARKATRPGADLPGLVGWWTFDEAPTARVALDYSGHRLGGIVRNARRAPGIVGRALVCDGGCVAVPDNPALSITEQLTLECWVWTDKRGQSNNWMINRVLAGGTNTGYRLGLVDDRPCFNVPLGDWTHHLSAPDPIPLGRWVHLAGVFDGRIMQLYVDGQEVASMERPGPIRPNNFRLHLGTYEEGHRAHFHGLIDEVRIFNVARPPKPAELRAVLRRFEERQERSR